MALFGSYERLFMASMMPHVTGIFYSRRAVQLGCDQSFTNQAFFMWQDSSDELKGMFIMHVDDFLYADSQTFFETIINKITEMYKGC